MYIVLGIAVVVGIILVLMSLVFGRAPEGTEDADGFHRTAAK